MAQTYEIDIERYNGADYDTLLPTPASHASTHQAGGSDPLTLQTGNYGDSSIPTSAYQNASVTRAKLAQDALYSPIVQFGSSNATATFSIASNGKTNITNNSSTDFVLTVPNTTDIPIGFETALLRYSAKSVKITFASGIKVLVYGNKSPLTAPSFTLETYAMVALKKLTSNTWLLTGPAEVV